MAGPTLRELRYSGMSEHAPVFHATTILAVRRNGQIAIGGDGQVSMGQTVAKATAKKVRRLGNGKLVAGFAGAAADAFTLFALSPGGPRSGALSSPTTTR